MANCECLYKTDGLEIHNLKKILMTKKVTIYQCIKVRINIVHDNVIFNAFQVIKILEKPMNALVF